jgi:hypothetical protein
LLACDIPYIQTVASQAARWAAGFMCPEMCLKKSFNCEVWLKKKKIKIEQWALNP